MPTRYGGMLFDDPVIYAPCKHKNSLDGETKLPPGVDFNQEAKVAVKMRHRTTRKAKANDIQSRLPEPRHSAVQWS